MVKACGDRTKGIRPPTAWVPSLARLSHSASCPVTQGSAACPLGVFKATQIKNSYCRLAEGRSPDEGRSGERPATRRDEPGLHLIASGDA